MKRTKAELLEELNRLRTRVTALETASVEGQLGESEEKFSKIFQSSAALMAISTLDDGRFIDVNDEFTRLLGFAREEVMGKTSAELHLFWESDQRDVVVASIKEQGYVRNVDMDVRTKSGSRIHGIFSADIISLQGQQCLLTVLSDMTRRRQSDNLIRLQRDLAHALNSADSVEEALDLCLKTAIDAAGMDSGGLYLVQKETGDVNLVHHRGLSDEFVSEVAHYPADSDIARLLSSGQPVYKVSEHTDAPNADSRLSETFTVRAAVPIHHNDTVVGCIHVASHSLEDICASSRDKLETVAVECGNAVSRLRDGEALIRNEAKYRMMFDNTPSAIAVYQAIDEGRDFVFVDFNRAGEKSEHISRAELIGRKVTEAFPGVEEFGLLDVLRRVNRTGQSEHHPITVYQDERVTGWRENFVYRLPSGEVVALYEDVTERKQAEEDQAASEKRYQEIFDTVQEGIVYSDENQITRFANPAVAEILEEESVDRVLGRSLFDYVSEDQRRAFQEQLDYRRETGGASRYEIQITTAKGSRKTILVSATPRHDQEGKFAGSVAAVLDISAHKQAEEALAASEKRYQEIFDAVQEGIGIVDENEIIKFANPAYAEIFEEDSVEQFVGKTLLDYIPEDQRAILAAQTESRKAAEASQYEIDIVTGKGNRKSVLVSVTPKMDCEGKYLGAVGGVLDISKRKAAENEIRKFKTISDTASYGTAISDLEGNLLYVNDCLARMHGYSPEELLGRNIAVFHSDEQMESVGRMNQALTKKGSFASVEMNHRHRDGHEFPTLMTGVVIKGEDGLPQYLAATAIDITETKRLQQLSERAQRLETAGRIAGQVAHDFNNLLGPLVAYPDFIREELGGDHQVNSYLEAIEDAAEQMADINQQLLTLGRRGHYNLEPLNLNRVVDQVLNGLYPIPSTLKIEIELCDNLKNVKAGAAQVFRAIANLVSNAVDAIEGIGTLRIKSENWYADGRPGNCVQIPCGDYVKITVADTGCGIAPEAQASIFEPFYTTKKAGSKRGSGLGLSVVHAVVRDHDGYIDLDSQVGVGTSVYLYLPITHDQISDIDEPAVPGGQEKILVVDDDQIQRNVTSSLLMKLGYEVTVAESGEEAIEYLREQQCELLVLDMVMPGGIDGTETFRQATVVQPGLRAVIVSGYAESGRMGVAQALGAGAFLKKPLTLKTIAAAVRGELDRVKQATPTH